MTLTTTAPAKTMTAAMKKADTYRDQMNMGRKDVEKVLCDDLTCVVYKYSNQNGQPVAICYKGRALKAYQHYRYRDAEQRDSAVSEFMEGNKKYKSNRRQSSERVLKVGDVLKASWGYEQTNIDYWMVQGLVGKTMVELVEIGCDSIPSENMTGNCIPNKTKIIGETIRKKANGESVKIDSSRYASLKKPKFVAGVEVYDADHWTSYA